MEKSIPESIREQLEKQVKNCPFCGEKPIISIRVVPYREIVFSIDCCSTMVNVFTPEKYHSPLIAAMDLVLRWNKRSCS